MNYGLIGNPLEHSISPKIHELLGNKDYQCCPLQPHEVEDFIKNGNWRGLNVTIPYKEMVLPYCDTLSNRAKAIGSVNTLIHKKDRIHGDNTDYVGFLAMAQHAGISFTKKKVTIFGDGGTGKMAKVAIGDKVPKKITVVSLDTPPHYEDLDAYRHCDILVNTTPVGMSPNIDECLCDLKNFPRLRGVIDVIYNPSETKLLQQAKELGIPYTNGLFMLIEQARWAAEQFLSVPIAKTKTIEIYEALKERL